VPDLNFEQSCPCGATIKVTGYLRSMDDMIRGWHNVHDKHMNASMKAKVGVQGPPRPAQQE